MVFGKVIKKKRSAWCLRKRHLSVYQCRQKVIFSDEGQVVIGNNHRIYVGEKQTSPIYPSACALIVNARFQLCCRGCISYDGVGTLCLVDGNVTVQKYMYIDILDEQFCGLF